MGCFHELSTCKAESDLLEIQLPNFVTAWRLADLNAILLLLIVSWHDAVADFCD